MTARPTAAVYPFTGDDPDGQGRAPAWYFVEVDESGRRVGESSGAHDDEEAAERAARRAGFRVPRR